MGTQNPTIIPSLQPELLKVFKYILEKDLQGILSLSNLCVSIFRYALWSDQMAEFTQFVFQILALLLELSPPGVIDPFYLTVRILCIRNVIRHYGKRIEILYRFFFFF